MQNDYVVLSRDPEYELETFYSKKFPLCPLPALVTASVVAKMIRLTIKIDMMSSVFFPQRNCVNEVITERGFVAKSSLGIFLDKVALRSDIRPRLERREAVLEPPETLEVLNSYKTPLLITIARMEQVR